MKNLKRVLMILLSFALVLSMVPVAFAAGEDDTYTLARPEQGDTTKKNIQYSSVFMAKYSFDNGKSMTPIQPMLYNMYNKTTLEEFPTYCLDINITATQGVDYRRLNLEDSTYSASAAGHIRAIMQNGFYIKPTSGESVDSLKTRALQEVEKLRAAAVVESLTISEAITATQCAIWQAAHGTVLSFPTFAYSYSTNFAGHKYPDLTRYDNRKADGVSYLDKTTDLPAYDARIRTVYDYLLSLPPVGPSGEVISAASFTKLHAPVVTDNGDGTYSVSVTTTVDVTGGDSLTLTASLGGQTATTGLNGNGSQTVTLTIDGVSADKINQDVKLSISGYQTVSGVFMFDARGDRDVAQTMVAKDDSRQPVYAEVVAQESRILNFRKTTNAGTALEGIVFDIFPVSQDTYNAYKDNPSGCPHGALATYTVITGSDGRASLNLTNHGLGDGVYLVVEKEHPAIVAPLAPFFVSVPTVDAQSNELEYEVTLRPKNEVKGGVKIEKDVISLGNDTASLAVGTDHTWIISATIPDDIAQGKSYVISDTLDNRLDYVDAPDNTGDDLKVTVETLDGETVVTTLTPDTDYTLTLQDQNSLEEGNPSDSFTVELTTTGMSAVAEALGTNNFANYRIRVRFNARINANAEPAEKIPNKGVVSYQNSVNFTFRAESDQPTVYMGAANLLKVDAKDNERVLPGATFEVYRKATQEEVGAAGDSLPKLEGMVEPMIQVEFYDKPEMTGAKVTSAATDENGKLAIYGLAYGTYYLVETQPPTGYNLSKTPITLTVGDSSHLEDNVLMVENSSGTVLPTTGGIGTTGYTFWGAALTAMSLLLLMEKKRRAGVN